MLNECLLSPDQVKIVRLELTIKKFKEYDTQRKQYQKSLEEEISSLKKELEEIKAQYSELLEFHDKMVKEHHCIYEIQTLRERVKNQRAVLAQFNSVAQ